MNELNCWEFKKCGREPNGEKTDELSICPAATDTSADCINGGKNGGRICWAIAGTFSGNIQGTFAKEEFSCLNCEFFELVKNEENVSFVLLKPGQIFHH
jgi:hypothetical protein